MRDPPRDPARDPPPQGIPERSPNPKASPEGSPKASPKGIPQGIPEGLPKGCPKGSLRDRSPMDPSSQWDSPRPPKGAPETRANWRGGTALGVMDERAGDPWGSIGDPLKTGSRELKPAWRWFQTPPGLGWNGLKRAETGLEVVSDAPRVRLKRAETG